ncbi:hypothetical protein TNCV_3949291 [Trichonephila clavipes]|nr:hypothetical protein TNCV_3949291 [Trichonephila clavipes]
MFSAPPPEECGLANDFTEITAAELCEDYTYCSRGDSGISCSEVHILTPTEIMDIKIKPPNLGSVFRSALIAMRRGLQFACETEFQFQDVWILTDSRASVQHISNWTPIRDHTSRDILNLDRIYSNHRVHFL